MAPPLPPPIVYRLLKVSMSELTPVPVLSPDPHALSRQRMARLRLLLAVGAALIVGALAYLRYDSSHAAPATVRQASITPGPSAPPSSAAMSLPSVVPTPPLASPARPGSTPAASDPLTALLAPSTPQAPAAPSQKTIAQLRKRVLHHPEDTRAHIQLVALLDAQGDAGGAEDVIRAALQRGRRDPQLYHTLGLLYMHHKQYGPATDAFKIETVLAPSNFEAFFKLALAASLSGNVKEARRGFERAAALNPKNPDVYMGLAFLNNTSERYQYAERYLQRYIQTSPNPGPGYMLLSRVYLSMRLYDKAIEAGKTGVTIMPEEANMWYNLGQAYSYRPDTRYLTEAAQAFERAVQISPNWGKARFELGRIYMRLNRIPEAIAQYREAVRSEPLSGRNHYQLAQLLMRQGQMEEGKREMAEAQRLIPLNQREDHLQDKISVVQNDPRSYFELAQVYKAYGQYDMAQQWLDVALRLSPNYPQARALEAEIRQLVARGPSRP
ncbi:MAG TPA: tetratricopeptide repeat protein [Chthonomonadaceae bacterium]|nr:tetratricopeptide repeat protein [Chthonomonadaceae bacterium]